MILWTHLLNAIQYTGGYLSWRLQVTPEPGASQDQRNCCNYYRV